MAASTEKWYIFVLKYTLAIKYADSYNSDCV
jgi:hypothetical protein